MSSKRIAVVIASDVLGGHEFQSAELAYQIGQGREVVILLNRRHFLPTFEIKKLNCEVHEGLFFNDGNVAKQILRGFLKQKKIAEALIGFDQVVVCAGAVEASVATGIASRLHGVDPILYLPFFYDRRVVWGCVGSIYNVLLRTLMNIYSQLITINAIQARLVRVCYKGLVSVVNNVVEDVPPLRLGPGLPRLVFIGRLDGQKRILELITALDFPENPYKHFVIIGDGPLREQMCLAIEQARHIQIQYLGWLNTQDQTEILRPTDILVLNSVIEGEPIVLREAAARGMLTVVADIPGVRGVTQRRFRYKNIDDLRHMLIKLYSNKFDDDFVKKFKLDSNKRVRQLNRIFDSASCNQ